jgi:hypothetical protein
MSYPEINDPEQRENMLDEAAIESRLAKPEHGGS